jgi:diguanylate cyclase (GGDEF)-like protein/PAS domain S-box-containing protein
MRSPDPKSFATAHDTIATQGGQSACEARDGLQEPVRPAAPRRTSGISAPGNRHGAAVSGWAIALLLLAATSLALTLLVSLSRQGSASARDKTADLAAIAQLKAAQISQRLLERRQSTYGVAADTRFMQEVTDWLRHGAPPGATAERIASHLRLARHADEFESVFLLDASGRVVLSDAPDNEPLARFALDVAAEAMHVGRVRFVDIHWISGASGAMRFGFVVPLGTPPFASASAASGALFFGDDPQRWLFPLTQSWPRPTTSGEALLMRRDAQESIYLHGLRHRQTAALTPWLPIEEKDLPTADLVLRHRGVLAGRDYRGVEVVAAAHAVPTTPWFLICKVDKTEAFGQAEQSARLAVLLLISVLALSTLTGYHWWRQHRIHIRSQPDGWRATPRSAKEPLAYTDAWANEAVLIADRTGRIVAANDRAVSTYGYSSEELLALAVADLDAPGATTRWSGWQPEGVVFETTHRRKDGSVFSAEISGRPAGADAARCCAIVRDISTRKQTEELMRLYAAVVETAAEAVLITDPDRRIVAVNPSFTEITGYRPDEAIGRTPSLLSSGRHDRAFYRAMWSKLNGTGRWQGEIWNRRKTGEIYPEWETITAIFDDQKKVKNYVAVFTDITERKVRDEKVSYLAYHDPLTMLPNRLLLEDRLEQAIRTAERSGRRVGVMLIDLDRFKTINDTLGHPTGDLVLQTVAGRLKDCVRHSDTVSRLGGDEFVVLLSEIGSAEDAAQVGVKIAAALTQPINASGHRLTVTPSLGTSVYPDDAATGAALLEHADMAMYRTRRACRSTIQLTATDLDGVGASSTIIVNRLH